MLVLILATTTDPRQLGIIFGRNLHVFTACYGARF